MWLDGRRRAQEKERETPIHQTLSEQEREGRHLHIFADSQGGAHERYLEVMAPFRH